MASKNMERTASALTLLALLGGTLSSSLASADTPKSQVRIAGQTSDVDLYPTGLLEDPEDRMRDRLLPMPPTDGAPALPSFVDLTSELPGPGNQGAQGSCVGWATAFAAKSFHEVVEEDWTSSVHEFSPAWIYNQINGGVDQGSYYSDALDLIVDKGADFHMLFDYDAGNFTRQPGRDSFVRAAGYKAASWNTLTVSTDNIKKILAGGNAVMIGIQVLPDFDALNSTTNTIYDTAAGTRPSCPTAPCSRGGHAIAIIGYDDSISAFKVINSWGTRWGSNGYGWIAYNFVTNSDLKLRAYVLTDKANSGSRMPPEAVIWPAVNLLK